MRLIRFMLPMLFVGLLTTPVSAQTVTGTVQGTVTDPTGAVLPGVTVIAQNLETGATRELTTNEVGFYSGAVSGRRPVPVTARLSGFGSIVRDEVEVGLNQTRVADFQLKPSTVVRAVTVIGAAPPINTTNAEIKGSLTAEQIIDKPTLNAGSFLSLAETFTGFQENPTRGQNNPTASSGSSINFNGTGTRGATFQINGVNNDDSSENQNRQGAALSTIKEFQVITNTYSAEFGRGYGAVVLVQTKSGTNSWHGDVYEYCRTATPDRAGQLLHGEAGQPAAPVRRHRGVPDPPNRLFGVRQRRSHETARRAELREGFSRRRSSGAPVDARQRHAGQSGMDRVDPARFPAGVTPNDPRSNRTYATVSASTSRRRTLPAGSTGTRAATR